MQKIYLVNLENKIRRKVIDEIGRLLADYFNNKQIMSTGEENIFEGFYIGNDPNSGNCYLVVYNPERGICIESLGESYDHIPIYEFINSYCDSNMRFAIERIIFKHS